MIYPEQKMENTYFTWFLNPQPLSLVGIDPRSIASHLEYNILHASTQRLNHISQLVQSQMQNWALFTYRWYLTPYQETTSSRGFM